LNLKKLQREHDRVVRHLLDPAERRPQGLGDLIHIATKKTGIAALVRKVRPGGCNCNKRRQRLNKLFPFPEKK